MYRIPVPLLRVDSIRIQQNQKDFIIKTSSFIN